MFKNWQIFSVLLTTLFSYQDILVGMNGDGGSQLIDANYDVPQQPILRPQLTRQNGIYPGEEHFRARAERAENLLRINGHNWQYMVEEPDENADQAAHDNYWENRARDAEAEVRRLGL